MRAGVVLLVALAGCAPRPECRRFDVVWAEHGATWSRLLSQGEERDWRAAARDAEALADTLRDNALDAPPNARKLRPEVMELQSHVRQMGVAARAIADAAPDGRAQWSREKTDAELALVAIRRHCGK